MEYRFKAIFALLIVNMLVCAGFAQDFPKITSREIKKINGKDIEFVTANGLRAVIAPQNDNSVSLSENLGLKHKKFLSINEISPSVPLIKGMVYYLEPKANVAPIDFHTTRERESLWEISQMYGVKLSKLLAYNRMKLGEQPQTGRVIWMKQKRPSSTPVEIKKLEIKPQPVSDTTKKITSEYYISQKGETAAQIAQKNGITEDSLYQLNPYLDRKLPIAENTILRVKPVQSPKTLSLMAKDTVKSRVLSDTSKAMVKKTITASDSSVRAKITVSLDSFKSNKPGRKAHLVMSGETLQSIATLYRISPADLINWNKLIDINLKPGQVLFLEPEPTFRMPTKEEEIAALDSGKHIVLPNQTLKDIAAIYGVTEKDLMQWNNLKPGEPLVPYRRLYYDAAAVPAQPVKTDPKTVSVQTVQPASNQAGEPVYHTVAAGEGLWSITKRYNVKIDDVQKWNNLTGNDIKAGQKLIVGYANIQTSPSAQTVKIPTQAEIDAAHLEGKHIVLPGETPQTIAAKYQVKVEEFCKWNKISPNTVLTVGQKLYYDAGAIPATITTTSPSASQPIKSEEKLQSEPAKASQNQPIIGAFEPIYHTVAPKEGMWSISKRYNTTTVLIRKWNSIEDDQIRAGEKIVVGVKPSKPATHIVATGEDLLSIARKYNLTEGWLKYLNGGDITVVPGKSIKIR